MKTILATLLAMVVSLSAIAETKKVCHKEKRKGKEVEVCKMVKVHKKLDGTKVPPK